MLAVSITSCTHEKSRILIIGDSISQGYTPYVAELLANEAEVHHNPGNAQHTGTGLENIDQWTGDGKWDIIQFNWGLWDLCYRHPDSKLQGNRDKIHGTITWPVDQYVTNLDSIVRILQAKTSARLIFVTTTYVPENEAGRFKEDARRYNEAAKKVMKAHAVTVNDIYEQSIPIHQEYGIGQDDVHYTEKGYEKLGELVARFLKKEIRSM